MEILKIFRMMDYKEIKTPMALILKLMSDASSDLVDATMYCRMIGSLMYLGNTRPDICFVVNVRKSSNTERGGRG